MKSHVPQAGFICHIPKIGRGVVNYVAFSPLDKLPFDPDLLILLADTDQTEILLRAMSYRTGKMWVSKFSAGDRMCLDLRLSISNAGN